MRAVMVEPAAVPGLCTPSLIRGAMEGDRRALEVLFANFSPWVLEVVRLRIGRSLLAWQEPEDIAQEVLLKVFRRLRCFAHGSADGFRGWLFRSVEREIVDQMRSMRALRRGSGRVRRFSDSRASLLALAPAPQPSSNQLAQAEELGVRIDDALRRMRRRDRRVLILRSRRALSYKRIAGILQLRSETAARKAFSRAAQKFKILLHI